MILFTTISRLINPPIDYYVEELKPFLKESYGKDASWIEEYVIEEISYQYDWQTYGYPLYFPTVKEVIQNGAGDCKSRLVVTSSILSFYEIQHSFMASPTHVWVDYEEKKERGNESQRVAMVSRDEENFTFKLPEIDWNRTSKTFQEAAWNHAPMMKKISLIWGFFISLAFIIFPQEIEKKILIPFISKL